ncbi:hypothetical protein [Allokutzneria oryzae]|uniref:Uncharacterized protein n=1 Tax=Allokutzneria oryzae TaxID=1378989 RepID=A0ABV6A4P7_9PSEU
MIEKELRDGLRGAVTDEPPLGFDPDEAVTRIGVKVRRRRATFGVAAAVVAVLGGAVLVQQSVGVGRGGGLEVAGQPPAPPAAITGLEIDFPWPPQGLPRPERYTQSRADEQAAGVRDSFLRAFLKEAPHATNAKAQKANTLTAGDPGLGPNVMEGGVDFRDQAGDTAVVYSVYSPRYTFHRPAEECVQQPQSTVRIESCHVSKLPDGTALVVDLVRGTQGGGAIASAVHYRLDGVVVRVSAYTYNPSGGGGPMRDRPALTNEQLVALATDRDLTM